MIVVIEVIVVSVLRRRPARMRGYYLCFGSSLIKEYRQASERQEFAHQSTCTNVSCSDLEVADLDGELRSSVVWIQARM